MGPSCEDGKNCRHGCGRCGSFEPCGDDACRHRCRDGCPYGRQEAVQGEAGEAGEALERPDSEHGIEYLTGIWLASFVEDRALRRGVSRWLAPREYREVMGFCSQLAKLIDADEFGVELLQLAGDPGGQFRSWCQVVDECPVGVRRLWPAAIAACQRARRTPANFPGSPFAEVPELK